MIDIADRQLLVKYLIDRGVFGDKDELYIRYFTGGVSGNVALVSDGTREVVAKQALPKLKVQDDWRCDPKRQIMEHKALEVYARIVPGSVPKPIFYDEEQYIMVREAAPESCVMWKEQLLDGLLDFNVAERSIRAMLSVHNGTAGNPAVMEAFADNQVFYELRINPYIEWATRKHPGTTAAAKQVINMLMDCKAALVHGDYSPKNILVSGRDIFILDMEVAHYGNPAFDLAFFFNHFLLKAIKHKRRVGAYLCMLRCMAEIYFNSVTCVDAVALERDTARTLAFLFLARVDGKSPAEYITGEEDKNLIRGLALEIIDSNIENLAAVTGLVERKAAQAAKQEGVQELGRVPH